LLREQNSLLRQILGALSPDRFLGESPPESQKSKTDAAYVALGKMGANYSRISKAIGVHRNTLMNSTRPEWVTFRLYFEDVRNKRGDVGALPRGVMQGDRLDAVDMRNWDAADRFIYEHEQQ